MAFFTASDSTRWQSQLTSRQSSCILASSHKTRTTSVFLWTENGNEKIFKYNRPIFGATCLTYCAIFVLQKCLKDNKQEFPEAHTSIMQQLYMNDFMQNYPSEEEARRSAEEIETVLLTGGFNPTKFLSNRPAALEELMKEEKAEMKSQTILVQT